MKIPIITIRTRGDLQPHTAPGSGLKRAAHHVQLISIGNFIKILIGFVLLCFSIPAYPQQTFASLDELLVFVSKKSFTLQSNEIKLLQAKKAKLAAVLSAVDVTGNLLSAQFTDNTKLGINIFPAEAFGGQPGTFKEIQTGVQYTTNLTNFIDIKLMNPIGFENIHLSKINIDLTKSNSLLTIKSLQENIAGNYYNIISLQAQIKSTQQNVAVADTLYQIANNKYQEGLVKQQDVNDTKVSYLTTRENLHQLEFLMKQYYISLKILCDIPENEAIEIKENSMANTLLERINIDSNLLNVNNNLLKEKYALSNYKSAKLAFAPTLSFQLSNSYNLFNTTFKPLTGKWINSNYLGLKLNIPIPSAGSMSNKYSTFYDYQLAKKATEQTKIKTALDQQQLRNDYEKALSQLNANQEIVELRNDTYIKNENLYKEGLLGLDQTLNSFNAMVNAHYSLISSQVSAQLSLAKIDINNKIK